MSKLKTNCPNCGAAIDPELQKCPYCCTSYFDMSSIDITNHEPFYLKIKMNINGKTMYVTQLVVPSIGDIKFTTEPIYASGTDGILIAFAGERHATTNISFEAVPSNHNSLIEVFVEE